MRALELVAIGDELLQGFTVDTNAAYLGRKLAECGVSIARRATVGDDLGAIAGAVREALDRTGAVITTGGLGPTTDDVTREAVARVFGRQLTLDEGHLEWMRERWKKRFGRDLPESNSRQAMMPGGARKLENRHGSAPGVVIEDERGWVAMLPGVPRELRGMTDDALLPFLRERGWTGSGGCIVSRTWRTTGIAESLLADKLSGVKESLAYLPGVDGVDLRATIASADSVEAAAALDRIEGSLQARVGEWIYGRDDDDMAAVVLDLCRALELRIAVAESCTGGLLGARLTAIPGSSDVFVGGVIAYSNEVKVRELGVPQSLLEANGAVSEPVVRRMAKGAQDRFRAEVALSITGVAGPSGGTPDKPVGLVWISAAVRDNIETRKIHSWGDRNEIRYRAAQAAMDLARRMLSQQSR